jgi:hypothetical protein
MLDPRLTLPTLERLQAAIPSNLDVNKVTSEWFEDFSSAIELGNVGSIATLFLEDGYWRDMLALTWDFRTFQGTAQIKAFLSDRLPVAKIASLAVTPGTPGLHQPLPDIAWINSFFSFDTDVGIASGIFRLVPLSSGEWKAHSMYTNLESLKGFPEKVGALRNPLPNHGNWATQREREKAFIDSSPEVLIIGGGHGGLDLAARLKALEVPTLIVERNARIGDNWRNRYEALCLHDPVWYNHRPYIPWVQRFVCTALLRLTAYCSFPSMWPVFAPAVKLANWLESYAESLELNVWTSSTVLSARQDTSSKIWTVRVRFEDGNEHQIVVNQVVFAVGSGGGIPNMPEYPGMVRGCCISSCLGLPFE